MFDSFLEFLANASERQAMDITEVWKRPETDNFNFGVLAVIDPIEINRNVTRNVTTDNGDVIREIADRTYKLLRSVKSCHEFLEIIRNMDSGARQHGA